MPDSPSAGEQYACDHAWLGGEGMAERVVLTVHGDRFASVVPDASDFDEVRRTGTHLPGVTLPGLVNGHSHAFHRALRGRTHGRPPSGHGSFWVWRQVMYELAVHLDPDGYHQLARAVFAEMLEAGITTVGEFHYLHHGPGGARYMDPNAMGAALVAAADEAGIRLTLLDAVYLTGDVGRTLRDPGLSPVQARFSDGDVEAWAARLADLPGDPGAQPTGPPTSHATGRPTRRPMVRHGAAIHSVRAVPADVQADVVDALADVLGPAAVLHAHVAEQPAEVAATREHHDRTPVQLLADAGAITDRFTAVHAVWLDDHDVSLLGGARAGACICPTTERDLADGIARADRLAAGGAVLSLGTDQHVHTDLLLEARGVEDDLRLATQERGVLAPEVLLEAATAGGARSLGWDGADGTAGVIAPGALGDLCVVGLSSARMAGVRRQDLTAGVVFAATADDVTHTMVSGRMVVADGIHQGIDVARSLAEAIHAVDQAGGHTPS